MTHEITVDEATKCLAELVLDAQHGDDVILLQDNAAVAKIVPLKNGLPKVVADRTPGSAKDSILYMADDFDAPLDDFKEYME